MRGNFTVFHLIHRISAAKVTALVITTTAG